MDTFGSHQEMPMTGDIFCQQKHGGFPGFFRSHIQYGGFSATTHFFDGENGWILRCRVMSSTADSDVSGGSLLNLTPFWNQTRNDDSRVSNVAPNF